MPPSVKWKNNKDFCECLQRITPRSYHASVFFMTTDDTPARPLCVCVCAAVKFVALVWCISRVAVTRSHAHIVAFNCTRHIMSVNALRLESAAELNPPPAPPPTTPNTIQTKQHVECLKKKEKKRKCVNSCTHSGFREHTHIRADLSVTLFLCWKYIKPKKGVKLSNRFVGAIRGRTQGVLLRQA